MNVACTFLAAVIDDTVHVFPDVESHPVHDVNEYPVAGAAVNTMFAVP